MAPQPLSHKAVFHSDIGVFVGAAHQPGVLEEIIHNLDYCDILVLGAELNPKQESLQLQLSALLGKHLDATNSTSGMSIYGRQPTVTPKQHICWMYRRVTPPLPLSSGVDSMTNYEQVIRQVHYYHLQPRQLSERRFRLTCSELNGRYTSNEFTIEVSHPAPFQYYQISL